MIMIVLPNSRSLDKLNQTLGFHSIVDSKKSHWFSRLPCPISHSTQFGKYSNLFYSEQAKLTILFFVSTDNTRSGA